MSPSNTSHRNNNPMIAFTIPTALPNPSPQIHTPISRQMLPYHWSCVPQQQRCLLRTTSTWLPREEFARYYERRRLASSVIAFYGENRKRKVGEGEEGGFGDGKKVRGGRRRRNNGVGADTILVELLRWWFKSCDYGFGNDLGDRVDDGEGVDVDVDVEEAVLGEGFDLGNEVGGDGGRDDVMMSYEEFPLTLRMGLSVNSDRFASKFVVIVADLLCDLIVWDIFTKVHTMEDFGRVLTGASLAYIFGDLVSAVYHWARHNFESFGFDPERIEDEIKCSDLVCEEDRKLCEVQKLEATKDFYRTVATHCLASVPFLAVLWISPHSDLTMQSFGVYIISIVSILPAFKQWSSSQSPPRAVSFLQRAGLMLRKSEKAISDVEYCLVSGLWNNILSTTKFFSRLEHLIVYMTQGKIVPRSWTSRKNKECAEEACNECGEQAVSGSSSDISS